MPFGGSYPALFDRELDPGEWYPSYLATYLERDVRMLLNVGDLIAFQTFLRLCAGRAGQLVNLSALGADAGVTHSTAKAWLSVLEASYVVWRLPPLHANLGKRLVKTPKLHFLDSGLVYYLLGIRSPQQLREHPLCGAIFVTWIASVVLKSRLHRGLQPSLSFYRDRKGSEVDLVVERRRSVLAVETRFGQTVAADFFTGLKAFTAAAADPSGRSRTSWSTGGAKHRRDPPPRLCRGPSSTAVCGGRRRVAAGTHKGGGFLPLTAHTRSGPAGSSCRTQGPGRAGAARRLVSGRTL